MSTIEEAELQMQLVFHHSGMEASEMTHNRHMKGTIRKLWPSDKDLYRDHLLRLDADSRRLRFMCEVSDDYIKDYADRMNDFGNIIFGYLENGELRAAAEIKKLADIWGREAEAAFSVETAYQNRGLGTDLMGRVIRTARNRGIRLLFMSCLAENAKMQAIARNYRAELKYEYGEVVGEIIPQNADYFSYIAEAMEDRAGYMLAVLDLQARVMSKAA